MSMCEVIWEPDARPTNTHTCSKPEGHEGLHLCRMCGSSWDRPRPEGGIVVHHAFETQEDR